MKNKASLQNKIYRKIHWIIFSKLKPGPGIRNWYPAYRHGKKYEKKMAEKIGKDISDARPSTVYITQVPNEGAGIGHQMANYIGGYHYSEIFQIPYAYSRFKDDKWENFLGFGENEISVKQLKKQGYKMYRLPYFDEEKDYEMIQNIISSYAGQKVILQTELDQFYQKQYEVIPHIKEKFETAAHRKKENKIYDDSKINIAVHIRRGDIVEGQTTGEETLTKRWLTMEYYENVVRDLVSSIQAGTLLPDEAVKMITEEGTSIEKQELQKVYRKIQEKREVVLHLFSQGKEEDYQSFEQYGQVNYCLDKGAMESFLMMVRADVLVISKSSFSYKPALLADGIRVCPPHFWHGYPDEPNWIVADEEGHIK